MKDIKGNDIKSGDKVHIFGNSQKDNEPLDINAIVLNMRGRGIKFVDEVTSREYTQDFIKEHSYKINILEPRLINHSTGEKTKIKSNSKINQEELDLIQKLESFGWYGNLTKLNGNIEFSIKLVKHEN